MCTRNKKCLKIHKTDLLSIDIGHISVNQKADPLLHHPHVDSLEVWVSDLEVFYHNIPHLLSVHSGERVVLQAHFCYEEIHFIRKGE